MRPISIFSCMALMACASANTPQSGPGTIPVETVRIQPGSGSGMTMSTIPNVPSHAATVAYPLDRVWGAVRAAYDSVSVPVAIMETSTGTIGNGNLRVRRRLGTTMLSRYINCGSTQGGPSADTYEVQLSVSTTVRPGTTAGTTTVTTSVEARGRPITISSEYTICTSTGALEARIVELVKGQLSR
jgi:hypothetical protein